MDYESVGLRALYRSQYFDRAQHNQISTIADAKGIQGNTSKAEIKCVCLNARSIINKKNELDTMVDEIKPHIIGVRDGRGYRDERMVVLSRVI